MTFKSLELAEFKFARTSRTVDCTNRGLPLLYELVNCLITSGRFRKDFRNHGLPFYNGYIDI